jgi:peroxiredoxin
MFMTKLHHYVLLIPMLCLAACGNMADDLNPSNNDLRPNIVANSIGNQPGQIAADFSAPATNGTTFKLSDYLAGGAFTADAVVLYFTMWCPICLSHTDHMLYNIIPRFQGRGTVVYVLVDYVSGSIASTIVSEAVNGYAGSVFTTIADENQSILTKLNGAMGKTIVIDAQGVIQMSEDFRTGDNLINTLNRILP